MLPQERAGLLQYCAQAAHPARRLGHRQDAGAAVGSAAARTYVTGLVLNQQASTSLAPLEVPIAPLEVPPGRRRYCRVRRSAHTPSLVWQVMLHFHGMEAGALQQRCRSSDGGAFIDRHNYTPSDLGASCPCRRSESALPLSIHPRLGI